MTHTSVASQRAVYALVIALVVLAAVQLIATSFGGQSAQFLVIGISAMGMMLVIGIAVFVLRGAFE